MKKWNQEILNNFLYSFNSQTIMSLSISLFLHNKVIIQFVNFSWHFVKIVLSGSVVLNKLLGWVQKYFWIDILDLLFVVCSWSIRFIVLLFRKRLLLFRLNSKAWGEHLN